jgi:hypothetical protein
MDREDGDQLVMELPGGGSLGYAGFGDPDGVPCFAVHGQSSSRLMPGWMFPPELLTAAGVRMIGVACWLVSIAAQVLSYRRSTGDRRQQLKWLMSGSAVALIAIVAGSTSLAGTVGGVVAFGFLALPLSIGVAVLRYRLFDIDRIISRTLAYAIVTGLLVGVYAGLVLLATEVFKFHSTVAVAASTLAAAALFNPVRRRVQRVVDRRFNRARYDAGQMVAGFAARLKDTVDLDSVRDDLAGVVHQALEPAHMSMWINERG